MDHQPIRIAVIDDVDIVRTGLSMVINEQPDMEVTLEVPDAQQTLKALPNTAVDVILIIVRSDGSDSIKTINTLNHELPVNDPVPKILVLTTFSDKNYFIAAFSAGISGLLVKDDPPQKLIDAIRAVYHGNTVLPPVAAQHLVSYAAAHTARYLANTDRLAQVLTEREREVFSLVIRGKSNAYIAETLFISEATVKTHVTRIFAKLGIRDRVHAVITAYEMGLITPETHPSM